MFFGLFSSSLALIPLPQLIALGGVILLAGVLPLRVAAPAEGRVST